MNLTYSKVLVKFLISLKIIVINSMKYDNTMISLDKALEIVFSSFDKTEKKKNVSIEDAIGYVLAENIVSEIDMPPFDKSAVDGFCFLSDDVSDYPVTLKCVATIQAGVHNDITPKSGECVKIMTGAPMPSNTDCVCMVEDTDVDGNMVTIKKITKKGDNVCKKAEDIEVGELILGCDTVIEEKHIAVLAAVGRKYVEVYDQPTFAIVNTGDEIIPVGEELKEGQIYNSNGPMLSALIKKSGYDVTLNESVSDNKSDLETTIKKGMEADILLISGGVSMGDYDFVPETLEKLGTKKLFHKVKVKPGKPMYFGKNGKTAVFGIPGNPVSNFLAYYLYCLPLARKMSGIIDFEPKFEKAVIGKKFKNSGNRVNFSLSNLKGKLITPISHHGSADIMRLSHGNCFLVAYPNTTLPEGATVEYFKW